MGTLRIRCGRQTLSSRLTKLRPRLLRLIEFPFSVHAVCALQDREGDMSYFHLIINEICWWNFSAPPPPHQPDVRSMPVTGPALTLDAYPSLVVTEPVNGRVQSVDLRPTPTTSSSFERRVSSS